MGLASGGPSPLAAFRHRRRQRDGELPGVFRLESGRSPREGPQKGTRVLGAEEDAARALLDALDDAQRTTAIVVRDAPGDI